MRKLLSVFFLSLLTPGLFANSSSKIPTRIMGSGKLTSEHLYAFFASTAANSDAARAARLAEIYIDEAQAEGVNHDIAFAQMVLETGFRVFKVW